MAISHEKEGRNLEPITPLLGSDNDELLDGYVDYKGYPSKRSKSGGWRSAAFILGQETRLSLYIFLLTKRVLVHMKSFSSSLN